MAAQQCDPSQRREGVHIAATIHIIVDYRPPAPGHRPRVALRGQEVLRVCSPPLPSGVTAMLAPMEKLSVLLSIPRLSRTT